MPLGKGVRYRVKETSKGPVRLAFKGKGKVVEAKNLKTGDTHTPAEFAAERNKKKGGKPMPKTKKRMTPEGMHKMDGHMMKDSEMKPMMGKAKPKKKGKK